VSCLLLCCCSVSTGVPRLCLLVSPGVSYQPHPLVILISLFVCVFKPLCFSCLNVTWFLYISLSCSEFPGLPVSVINKSLRLDSLSVSFLTRCNRTTDRQKNPAARMLPDLPNISREFTEKAAALALRSLDLLQFTWGFASLAAP